MKNHILFYNLITLLMFASTGCKKECDYWYKGDDCSTEVRQDYFGLYNGTYEENDLTPLFLSDRFDVDVTVTAYPNDPKGFYLISPFDSVYAVLSSETTFSIPFHSYPSPGLGYDSYDVEGSGSFTGSQVTFSYDMVLRGGPNGDVPLVFSFDGLK